MDEIALKMIVKLEDNSLTVIEKIKIISWLNKYLERRLDEVLEAI